MVSLAMSMSKTPEYTCEQCGDKRHGGDSFCSEACRETHQGEKLLNAIKHDHRLCSVCFNQTKEVEEPTDETKLKVQGIHSTESLVGYQYLLPDATQGHFGTECICGNIDADGLKEIREQHDFVSNLKHAVDFLRERSKTEKEFDPDVFCTAYKDDLAYAIGRALHES